MAENPLYIATSPESQLVRVTSRLKDIKLSYNDFLKLLEGHSAHEKLMAANATGQLILTDDELELIADKLNSTTGWIKTGSLMSYTIETLEG